MTQLSPIPVIYVYYFLQTLSSLSANTIFQLEMDLPNFSQEIRGKLRKKIPGSRIKRKGPMNRPERFLDITSFDIFLDVLT